jgi:transposase
VVRTKNTFLKSRCHRLAARRGKKRAIVAIARLMLVSVWDILALRQPYKELSGDYFDRRGKEAKVSYLHDGWKS